MAPPTPAARAPRSGGLPGGGRRARGLAPIFSPYGTPYPQGKSPEVPSRRSRVHCSLQHCSRRAKQRREAPGRPKSSPVSALSTSGPPVRPQR
eukprot:scaffold23232_cov131-Isochrysis_galbana.AAC.10